MAHADNLRRYFPVVQTSAYLNTALAGPLPAEAADAMQQAVARVLSDGRTQAYQKLLHETRDKVRVELAGLLKVQSDAITLTDGLAHGLNLVMQGLQLRAGDEVIVTNVESTDTLLPVFAMQQRGVVVRTVDATLGSDSLCTELESMLSPRSRLFVCAHVVEETGQRLPIERLAAIVHKAGAWCAVDGSNGVGAEPFDVAGSGADFYAFPAHKWLCGPDGAGALYVRPSLWTALRPAWLGEGSLAHPSAVNRAGSYLTAETATRYEHASSNLILWAGWLASLQFLRVTVGWDYAYTRIRGLSGQLMEQLLDLNSIRILTPRDSRAGIVTFQMTTGDAGRIAATAADRQVYVQAFPENRAIRVSTGFYNSEDDLARIVNLLRPE